MLRDILERIPGARLAFVGDGPERESLERHFAGTRTVFTVCTTTFLRQTIHLSQLPQRSARKIVLVLYHRDGPTMLDHSHFQTGSQTGGHTHTVCFVSASVFHKF